MARVSPGFFTNGLARFAAASPERGFVVTLLSERGCGARSGRWAVVTRRCRARLWTPMMRSVRAGTLPDLLHFPGKARSAGVYDLASTVLRAETLIALW